VIVRDDLMGRAKDTVPTMFKYSTHADKNSMFNTPPCFPIYICKLALEWLKENGGIAGAQQRNEEKAKLIYDVVDGLEMYNGFAQKDSRSVMNLTFRLKTEELEAKFIEEATAKNLIGLKGHRSVGGCRASIYNAMTVEGAQVLSDFMKEFADNNG